MCDDNNNKKYLFRTIQYSKGYTKYEQNLQTRQIIEPHHKQHNSAIKSTISQLLKSHVYIPTLTSHNSRIQFPVI